MDLRRRTKIGFLLRLAGAALLGVAVLAGRSLSFSPGEAATALGDLLALIAFAAASAGSALLIVGPGLLDPVPLSARWAPWRSERWPGERR